MIYDYLEGGVEVDQKNVFLLVNKLCAYKVAHLVEEYDPDILVCTHFFSAQLANELKRGARPGPASWASSPITPSTLLGDPDLRGFCDHCQ